MSLTLSKDSWLDECAIPLGFLAAFALANPAETEQTQASEGFADIKDVHRMESFDFSATRDGVPWSIEVKGTTSPVAESFLLTAAELTLHRMKTGFTALVLVHDIELMGEGNTPIATGGTVELLSPWSLEHWEFEPIAYKARRVRRLAV